MELKYKPDFRIVADCHDITSIIRNRLVSLSLTDEAGLQSDTLELVLADHDPSRRIVLPPTGAELEVWLGYTGALCRMGLFVVDELELSGPPGRLVIKAKAAVQTTTPTGKSSLYSQKTRSWPTDTAFSSLVETIAAEHGLRSAVSPDVHDIRLPHVDQVSESDINLLIRLGRDASLVIKPADGALVVSRRGQAVSASGQSLPAFTVREDQVSSWRFSLSRREKSGSVVAVYRDLETAADQDVVVGEGEPVRRLRHHHPDRAGAEHAARAAYGKSCELQGTLSLDLPGDSAFMAEARLNTTGFRDGLDQEWVITRATHSLDDSGYSVRLEAHSCSWMT